jgi:Tfp pilus assembly protein PilN
VIKINLALKKQSAVTNTPASAGSESNRNPFASLSKFDLKSLKTFVNPELLKDPKIRKFSLVIVICAIAAFSVSTYEASQVQKLDDTLTKINADNMKLAGEVAKTKGYEAIKVQLDKDEQILRTKLDTIKKLITDRQIPPKLLLALSNDIPSQLWLSSCVLTDKEIKVAGSAVGYDQIADFVKNLGESELLTDVKLVSSKQDKDANTGIEIATFELSAKRK